MSFIKEVLMNYLAFVTVVFLAVIYFSLFVISGIGWLVVIGLFVGCAWWVGLISFFVYLFIVVIYVELKKRIY